MLGFIVGAAITAQTFYLFVVENIRQFGALKAIGTTNTQILRMVLVQAGIVGAIGYGLGLVAARPFRRHQPSAGAGGVRPALAGHGRHRCCRRRDSCAFLHRQRAPGVRGRPCHRV
ncbi:FtsX-like permease family protein [Hankyongella ginsenosidimutans]|uniref:FtsX-like permease family protein n=1 Tax=Hankyongella ginsenosidimutans TaxID=1763828 RepID=UPI001CA37AAE|nr:ABC transporter permease [Hankyongella ginsenosidimutans]